MCVCVRFKCCTPQNKHSTCQEAFPKGNSSSNPSVSGAMLVSGRVVFQLPWSIFDCVWFKDILEGPHATSQPPCFEKGQTDRCSSKFCLETCRNTVDGRNPANQVVDSLSHYLQGFIHPSAGFLSPMNSSMNMSKSMQFCNFVFLYC